MMQNNILTEVIKQTTNPVLITNSDLEFNGPEILYVNDAFTRMSNYTLSEIIGKKPTILRGANSNIVHASDLKKIIDEDQSYTFTTINYKKDGSEYNVKVNIFPIYDDNNSIIHYASIQEDISNHIKNINYLQKFIDLQNNIIILSDGKHIKFANQKFFDFFGFKDLIDFTKYHQSIAEKFIEDNRFFNMSKVSENHNWIQSLKNLPHAERIVTMLGKNFKIYAFAITINNFDADIDIVTFSNISQTILHQIELEDKATHDKLTYAFNREYFEQNYRLIINKFHISDSYLAIAMLDIDHFKKVNDTYGHDAGDEVLKRLVDLIHDFSRDDDILIRWGGEEFILMLKVKSTISLNRVLEHIRKVIEMEDFETVHNITCSFGGTLYIDSENIDDTIKRADKALYASKETGRNKITII